MKEQLWRWSVLTALWLAATTTFGQTVFPAAQTSAPTGRLSKVLTLQDCLRLAEFAPSAISVAERERAIADRDVSRARAAFMPRAEMLNGFIYNSPRLNDRSTFSFLPSNGIREYTTLGAVTQEFDTSGRLRAEFQRTRAGQDAARVNFEIARRDLRRAVTVAYYRLLLTRHLVTVVGDALKESRALRVARGCCSKAARPRAPIWSKLRRRSLSCNRR